MNRSLIDYLPSIAVSTAVGFAVVVGILVTQDIRCLYGLLGLIVAQKVMPYD